MDRSRGIATCGGVAPTDLPRGLGCRGVSGAVGAMNPGQLPLQTRGGGLPGMHWKGGAPPPPLQGAQPVPSHCLPDAKCQPQRHL